MSEGIVISKEYNYNLLTVGQTICVPIEVNNDSAVSASDVIVKLKKVPDGLSYSTSDLNRGEFDENINTWILGVLGEKEQGVMGNFCFVITDDSKAPFVFNFEVSLSEYCDTCKEKTQYCVKITGLTCNDLADCGLLTVAEGAYEDDVDAGNNGVAVDNFYELSDGNLYGLPAGHIKKRLI